MTLTPTQRTPQSAADPNLPDAKTALRRQQVAELFLQGQSYRAIAVQLGIGSLVTIQHDIDASVDWLAERLTESLEEARSKAKLRLQFVRDVALEHVESQPQVAHRWMNLFLAAVKMEAQISGVLDGRKATTIGNVSIIRYNFDNKLPPSPEALPATPTVEGEWRDVNSNEEIQSE